MCVHMLVFWFDTSMVFISLYVCSPGLTATDSIPYLGLQKLPGELPASSQNQRHTKFANLFPRDVWTQDAVNTAAPIL